MWLIHLGTELGSARLRDADSAARAVLLGKVRRRGRVRAGWCSKSGANVTVVDAQSETQAEPLSVQGCSKRNGMLYGARRRSSSESAKFGHPGLDLEQRPRRGSARYQSLWALWNGGFRARTPRAMAPTAHYNHGEQFSHAQREKKGGKGHGMVITPS